MAPVAALPGNHSIVVATSTLTGITGVHVRLAGIKNTRTGQDIVFPKPLETTGSPRKCRAHARSLTHARCAARLDVSSPIRMVPRPVIVLPYASARVGAAVVNTVPPQQKQLVRASGGSTHYTWRLPAGSASGVVRVDKSEGPSPLLTGPVDWDQPVPTGNTTWGWGMIEVIREGVTSLRVEDSCNVENFDQVEVIVAAPAVNVPAEGAGGEAGTRSLRFLPGPREVEICKLQSIALEIRDFRGRTVRGDPLAAVVRR